MNPAITRLILRAVLAGVVAGISAYLNAPAHITLAVTAGVLAAGEAFTPLNAVAGFFKRGTVVENKPPTGGAKP